MRAGPSGIVEMPDGVVVAGSRPDHVAFRRPGHLPIGAPAGEDIGAGAGDDRGKVIAVLVAPGQAVKLGVRVAVMEAMKMEHSLTALRQDGVVAVAAAGTQVVEGAAVVRLEPGEGT